MKQNIDYNNIHNHISLQQYFKHEAYGFTPWLEDNYFIFQDILQDDNISIYKRECKVDKFYVDLLLRNNKNDNLVVVENQFGLSNHDHLGKIVSYTSLLKAKQAIWICEEYRKEHLKIQNCLSIPLYLCVFELQKTNQKEQVMLKIIIHGPERDRILLYKLNGTDYLVNKKMMITAKAERILT